MSSLQYSNLFDEEIFQDMFLTFPDNTGEIRVKNFEISSKQFFEKKQSEFIFFADLQENKSCKQLMVDQIDESLKPDCEISEIQTEINLASIIQKQLSSSQNDQIIFCQKFQCEGQKTKKKTKTNYKFEKANLFANFPSFAFRQLRNMFKKISNKQILEVINKYQSEQDRINDLLEIMKDLIEQFRNVEHRSGNRLEIKLYLNPINEDFHSALRTTKKFKKDSLTPYLNILQKYQYNLEKINSAKRYWRQIIIESYPLQRIHKISQKKDLKDNTLASRQIRKQIYEQYLTHLIHIQMFRGQVQDEIDQEQISRMICYKQIQDVQG